MIDPTIAYIIVNEHVKDLSKCIDLSKVSQDVLAKMGIRFLHTLFDIELINKNQFNNYNRKKRLELFLKQLKVESEK